MSTPTQRDRADGADTSAAPRWRRLSAALEWPTMGALAAGLVAALWWGLPMLLDRSDELSRELGAASAELRLVLPKGSEWLPPEEEARLAATLRAELSESRTLDRSSLSRAARSLEATGWFSGPVQLRRPSRSVVVVETPLRRPVAFVRLGESELLVDRTATLLPWSLPAGAAEGLGIVIRGASLPPPARPGEIWPGGDLAEAVRLVGVLAGRNWSAEIVAIEIEAVARGGPAILRTRGGTAIVWGRAPQSATASEVPVATRLAYLDRVHAAQGDLEAPAGRRFDLRLDYLATLPDPPALAGGGRSP
jgi:hypothetical protein